MWNSTTFLVEGAFRMSHRISSELPLETSGRLAATGSGVVVVVEEHIVVGLAVVVLTRAVGFIGVIVGHVVVGEPCWLKDHFS
jgi:hypothetical protein